MTVAANIEQRQAAEVSTSGRKLTGYAAVFDRPAMIEGRFEEIIRRGAFQAALRQGGDVLALVDHDPHLVLARTRSGTLRLEEDEKGLRFELDIPDTSAGRDVLALAERGDLGGMSFGFSVPTGGERWEGKRRELRSLALHEISVVSAWPAYQGTSVSARSNTPNNVRTALARAFLETIR